MFSIWKNVLVQAASKEVLLCISWVLLEQLTNSKILWLLYIYFLRDIKLFFFPFSDCTLRNISQIYPQNWECVSDYDSLVWVGAFSRNWAKLSDFTFCSEWTVFCWMQSFFGSRKNYSWKCTVCPYVTFPGHDIPWENKQLACFLFLLMSLHHNFSALLNRGYWLGVFLYVLHPYGVLVTIS